MRGQRIPHRGRARVPDVRVDPFLHLALGWGERRGCHTDGHVPILRCGGLYQLDLQRPQLAFLLRVQEDASVQRMKFSAEIDGLDPFWNAHLPSSTREEWNAASRRMSADPWQHRWRRTSRISKASARVLFTTSYSASKLSRPSSPTRTRIQKETGTVFSAFREMLISAPCKHRPAGSPTPRPSPAAPPARGRGGGNRWHSASPDQSDRHGMSANPRPWPAAHP